VPIINQVLNKINMKSKTIYFAILVCLIVVNFGYRMWNKPHKETANVTADAVLSPSALLTEYNANEDAANSKYLDKIIEVKGKVRAINTVDTGSSLSLDTGDEMASIICEFEQKEITANVQVGDEISVKGFCTGKLMDVVLVRCSLK
jgi:hypothetical protein